MSDYAAFIERKSQDTTMSGFDPIWMPDFLFPFQQSLVDWALRKGKSALFEDCGLGKTPQQLVWAENVVRKTNKRVLIATPLAVGQQTVKEGEKFGIEVTRSRDGTLNGPGIYVTNYEQLHKFNPEDFGGMVCDESSILKHFSGATQKEVTRFMSKIHYRLLCTATAAPNDYTELGTSSEALGALGYSDMLSRFFVMDDKKRSRMNDVKLSRAMHTGDYYHKLAYRVAQQIGQWRLKGHAETAFWKWICSWARACRKPSDLGFDDAAFLLPELAEREHIIQPSKPRADMLFTLPAVGLQEEREERRRTLYERCEYVAELVKDSDSAVIWCQMNAEGELLEKLIPYSLEVAGRHDDDYSETVAQWFVGDLCLCSDKRFSAKLASWQNDRMAIGRSTIERIAQNDCGRQSNTSRSIETSESCISQNTTEPTKQNTSAPGNSKTLLTLDGEIVTGVILKTAPGRKRKSRSTDNCGLTLDGLAVDAQSAEAGSQAIQGQTDSTLTTATQAETSGDCSAPIAILGSESLAMIQNVLNEPPCICGHAHGPRRLISKAKIFGFGINFQNCNHVVTFASHSYEQFYQSVRRCWRFGQTRPVTVDIVASEGERHVRENMSRKSDAADKMFAELVRHMNDARAVDKTRYNIQPEIPSWLSKIS